MAPANGMWLLIIAFSIVVSAEGNCLDCRKEALLAVQENGEDVIVSIYDVNLQSNSSVHDSVKYSIIGHSLSEECGPKLFRCQNYFEETFLINKTQHSVFFVPLQVGIAILDIVRYPRTYNIEHTILRTDQPVDAGCSPSAVFKILDGYFAVCTNQTTNFVSVVEVRLNKTALMSSQVLYPTNRITIPVSMGNISTLSNVIHIEIDPIPEQEYLIFAINTAIFSLRPFIYEESRLGDIANETCDRVQSLVPLIGSVFYAYCTNHFFTYDIGYSRWITQYATSGGIPYLCPEPETHLNVFPSYLEYTIDGLNKNVDLQGDSPSRITGQCFGNESQTYFAVQAERIGVSILNLTSSEFTVVPEMSACGDNCLPLLVVDDRYLIIRNPPEQKVQVWDFFGDHLKLIDVAHEKASLVTLLQLECPPSTPGGKNVPVNPVSPASRHRAILVPVIIPAAVFLLILIMGVSGLLIYYYFHAKQGKSYTIPISETQANTNEDKGSMVTLSNSPEQETSIGREKNFQGAGFKFDSLPTDRDIHNNGGYEMNEILTTHEELSAVSQSSDISSIQDNLNLPLLKK